MKILIVSQYFWPESFRINDLALDLVSRGYDVTVLTGKPNYPGGKVYSGYSFWNYQEEIYNGIRIIRVPIIPRGSASGIRLIINYLSFVISGCLYFLFNRTKYDVSLTFATSPITSVYPALLHKRLCKSKAFLWVQDLWPESVSAAGKMKSSVILKFLNRMVSNIYSKSDQVLVQSEAFIQSVEDKGVPLGKIKYLPNWAEDIFENKEILVDNKYDELFPEGFKVVFTGNIGEAQDFDSILKAAELTKELEDIKWIIIGDGRKRSYVEKKIVELGIANTFFLLGRYPLETMPTFLNKADVLLTTLKDEYIFSLTIPSKVQSYMAFGKPIIAMLNGIGSDIINDARCGYTVKAGDYESLAAKVKHAYMEPQATLLEMGDNGQKYYKSCFSKDKLIDYLLNLFEQELKH